MICKVETERLIIRNFTPEDWSDLYEYLSDEEVLKFEPFKPFSEEDCKEEALYRSEGDTFLAVSLKSTGKVIGNLYFSKEDFMTWELGYIFNSKYHRKGYATESVKAIMKYSFENLGTRRIIANCDPRNIPSWKLLEAVNMRREGHLLQNIYFFEDENGNPLWKDTYEYGMLVDEWKILNMK
ncbi:GNAT family N-acetyltransferase [Clostridium sp.]|uniref:GNAT family N-acetyltransferase n=1 Tax=Clostridium sp. TaxID=1506 RepID=UPI00346498C1